MKLYFVAGEASGDARGAELMGSLRAQKSDLAFFGFGGPRMRAIAGGKFHDWSDEAGVIGVIDVVKKYRYFKRQFKIALGETKTLRPDALVLIDYPGFNLRLATAVKRRPRSPRIIYYISPQVWAWNRGRIPKMARVIDLMLCIFPFEKSLYEESGLRTIFVGHPMVDALGKAQNGIARDEKLIGLFPGSREREVRKIFPVMLETAAKLREKRGELKFEAAAASEKMRELMMRMVAEIDTVPCEISLKNSHDLMQRATAGLVASGTATLEAAFLRMPHVLVYRVAALTFYLARKLVRVRFLGIANILADREIVREFIQHDAEPEQIVPEILRLIEDVSARENLVRQLDLVIAKLGEPGASDRAAAAVIAQLETCESA